MIPGIKITDTQLEFTEYVAQEIGVAKFCESFKLNLEDIILIGISPRLALDDESIFILLIDNDCKTYPIPDSVIGTKGLADFESYFELKSISKEWEKFEYKEYYGTVDKVIYPKEKYWENVFQKDYKLKIRSLYSWIKPKSFYGNFNRKRLNHFDCA